MMPGARALDRERIEAESQSRENAAAPVVLLIIGVVGIALLQAWLGLSPSSHQLVDTDGYMRALRVEELLSGRVGWFESWAPRANAPFGHSMHWTRPLDVLVAGMAQPFRIFLPVRDAVYWGALLQGVALVASLAVAVEWAARPLVGGRVSFLAGIGIAVQPSLVAYTAIGRVDHHALLFLLFALLVGTMQRAWSDRHQAPRSTVAGGIVAALGLWVSTEFLLPIALVLAYGALIWIQEGDRGAILSFRFSLSWMVATGIALALERGLDVGTVSFDRISIVYLLVAVLVALAWLAVGRWPRRLPSAPRRAAAIGVAGAAVALVIAAVFPRFFGGPFVDVPTALQEAWLSRVAELLPLWPVGNGVATAVFVMGAPVGALVIGGFVLARRPNRRLESGWPFVVGVLAVMVLLGFLQLRFSTYAQILGTIAWAWLAGEMLARIPRRSLFSSAGRVGAMALAVSGFLIPAMVASAIERYPSLTPEEIAAGRCSMSPVAAAVDGYAARVGIEAPIVLANVDFGPELLYRSNARVIATPYHRNVSGILDVRRALLSTPDAARAEVVDPRGVDLIVICERRDREDLGRKAEASSAFYSSLVEGRAPPWLSPVRLDDESASGVHIFSVRQ